MLLFFVAGAGATLVGWLIFIILFLPRNRKVVCFGPPTSLVSKALQARYRPGMVQYQRYARRV